jgi:hypothetical protein
MGGLCQIFLVFPRKSASVLLHYVEFILKGEISMNKNIQESIRLAEHFQVRSKKPAKFLQAFRAVEHVPEYSDATYCEGIAVFVEGDGTLEFEHAWIEHNGEIIDPAYPADELRYFPGLKCDGGLGISQVMREKARDDLPLFYGYGFGGHDLPSFREARKKAADFCASKRQAAVTA